MKKKAHLEPRWKAKLERQCAAMAAIERYASGVAGGAVTCEEG